jgi:E3 ubiquitin-protein ligase TRIP12
MSALTPSTVDFISESFICRASGELEDFVTHRALSEQLALVLAFPCLFPREQRVKTAKACSFDVDGFITQMSELGGYRSDGIDGGLAPLELIVKRDDIFEDGLEVLRSFCWGRSLLHITFAGEQGIGPGLTNEFVALLSHEFSRQRLGLFRSLSSDRNFCFDPQGLFPRPDADPEMFRLLGVLFAKALCIQRVLDIPLNPSFFRLLRGKEVVLQDVDSILHSSLQCENLGDCLDFTYPGISSLELKPGGAELEVTATNRDEYVKLVEEFTCGAEHFRPIVDAFLKGYHMVCNWDYLAILSEDELLLLFCGEPTKPTMSDLIKYVAVNDGYDEESPQIAWFRDLLIQMKEEDFCNFVKFATGLARLPIGGIKSLEPRLTIKKSAYPGDADTALPCASTCQHVFMLPEYSSAEIMEAKVMQAIGEARYFGVL